MKKKKADLCRALVDLYDRVHHYDVFKVHTCSYMSSYFAKEGHLSDVQKRKGSVINMGITDNVLGKLCLV